MDAPVLQSQVFDAPWDAPSFRGLPGLRLAERDGWIAVDDAFADQMSLREKILSEKADLVLAQLPEARAAIDECLSELLKILPRFGYSNAEDRITRPDGQTVAVDRENPLDCLGRLTQSDTCILQAGQGGSFRLTAAALCFPFGWTLSEKIGHSMARIHMPIGAYDEAVGARVDRLLAGLKVGAPVWRANQQWQETTALFTPRSESAGLKVPSPTAGYLRTERQCLVRLPQTGAIAFTIHTCLVPATKAPPALAALREAQ